MSHNKYFTELANKLSRLNAKESEEAINFYKEYAFDANLSTYEELTSHFGKPQILASKIYSESATKVVNSPKLKDKYHALSLTLIALLSLPLSLPLIVIIFALAISAFFSIFAILISFGLTAIALFVSGLAFIFYFSFTFINPFLFGSILKCLGAGLILIAVSFIFMLLVGNLIKLIIKLLTHITSSLIRKVNQHD